MDADAPEKVERSLNERAGRRGGEASIIQSFGIRGLYGYRTISLSSDYAATILIARNGTGKTTLLGALDAFLRFQLTRFRSLEFDELYCKLRGDSEELVLTSDDVRDFLNCTATPSVVRLSTQASIPVSDVFDIITGDYVKIIQEAYDNTTDSPASMLVRSHSFDKRRLEQLCASALSEILAQNVKLHSLYVRLKQITDEYEVVYLPTYRRVELALAEEIKNGPYRQRARPKFAIAEGSLHTGDIQFGLLDISDRLQEINRQIVARSNSGYRELSENIINELINGYDVDEEAPIPEPADLKLFFSRLESGEQAFGPYYRISAPDFERIYSGEGVPADSRKFLRYFLNKLLDVVNVTKALERPVEEFVFSCNKYLSSTEPSTDLDEPPRRRIFESYDGKALRMNPKDLSVYVESLPALRPISLDALSSGEKQMISLLAKIHLYPKKKIVLIDEPELSLSIDWQRGILIDVMLAPLCEQVIAITHSPFIFENALQPYARSMRLELNRQRQADMLAAQADEFGVH